MEAKNILLEKKEYISVVTINHPPANAWNLATMEEFKQVVNELEGDKDTRVVIITGAGEKCFSAGFDVSDAANAPKTSPMGRAKALDMILFSKTVGPAEALAMGLVNQISQPGHLMDDALLLARTLAQRPPVAVGCVLRAMAAGAYGGIDEGLRVEEQGALRVRDTKDRVEGFTAFLEKRKAGRVECLGRAPDAEWQKP